MERTGLEPVTCCLQSTVPTRSNTSNARKIALLTPWGRVDYTTPMSSVSPRSNKWPMWPMNSPRLGRRSGPSVPGHAGVG